MKVIYLISALYLLSSLIYGTYLWSQKRKISRAGVYFAIAGVLVHTASVGCLPDARGCAGRGYFKAPFYLFVVNSTCLFGLAVKVQDPSARRVRAPGGFSRDLALRDHSRWDDYPGSDACQPLDTCTHTVHFPWGSVFRDIVSSRCNLHISGKPAQVEKNRNPPEKTSFPDNPRQDKPPESPARISRF